MPWKEMPELKGRRGYWLKLAESAAFRKGIGTYCGLKNPAERPIEKPPGHDGTYYLEGLEKTPRPVAIVKAIQLMVDSCDWLVCYVRHRASNSRNLLEYAQCREKKGLIQIINIAEGMGTNLRKRNYCGVPESLC